MRQKVASISGFIRVVDNADVMREPPRTSSCRPRPIPTTPCPATDFRTSHLKGPGDMRRRMIITWSPSTPTGP